MNAATLDRKLTVAELAAKWTWSRQKLYRLVYANAIPYVRIGRGRGGIYFEESAVEAWLEQRRRRPDVATELARRRVDEPRDWGLPVENVFGL